MDGRQREFERRALAGDEEAEARLLLERLRSGDLSEESLSLAAYLGYPAALRALGDKAPVAPSQVDELAAGVPNDGPDSRAAVALAFVAMEHNPPETALARAAVEAAEDWILCPCEKHKEAARQAAWAIGASLDQDETVTACCYAAWSAWTGTAGIVVKSVLEVVDADVALQAMVGELVPWALGYSDPIRDRVESREQTGS